MRSSACLVFASVSAGFSLTSATFDADTLAYTSSVANGIDELLTLPLCPTGQGGRMSRWIQARRRWPDLNMLRAAWTCC